MVELTGTLNYVVPTMLSVLLAKTVADGLEKRGIYDLVIEYVFALAAQLTVCD
jgi:chloride channel 3/4/5